jgi:hypothetical protein
MSDQQFIDDVQAAAGAVDQLARIDGPLTAVECVYFLNGEDDDPWPESFLLRFGAWISAIPSGMGRSPGFSR